MKLLSATGVAKELGVAERTVRRWVKNGRLPAERRGRSLAIRLDDAERLRPPARLPSDDVAELRGRYLELRTQVERLEELLREERRRADRLEERLARRAA